MRVPTGVCQAGSTHTLTWQVGPSEGCTTSCQPISPLEDSHQDDSLYDTLHDTNYGHSSCMFMHWTPASHVSVDLSAVDLHTLGHYRHLRGGKGGKGGKGGIGDQDSFNWLDADVCPISVSFLLAAFYTQPNGREGLWVKLAINVRSDQIQSRD